MKKTNNKQRLFEMMVKINPEFKPVLNEEVSTFNYKILDGKTNNEISTELTLDFDVDASPDHNNVEHSHPVIYDIDWDKSKHNEYENNIISNYLQNKENWETIEDSFVNYADNRRQERDAEYRM